MFQMQHVIDNWFSNSVSHWQLSFELLLVPLSVFSLTGLFFSSYFRFDWLQNRAFDWLQNRAFDDNWSGLLSQRCESIHLCYEITAHLCVSIGPLPAVYLFSMKNTVKVEDDLPE